jgi:hypothetical protein
MKEASMTIDPVRTGLMLGLFLALFHAVWALLVAMGWAQPLMNFVFWAHFITPPERIEPFEWARAAILVGFVFIVGVTAGGAVALLWNSFAPRRSS